VTSHPSSRANRPRARDQPDVGTLLFEPAARRPSSQMPPLGTVLRDDQAIAAVSKWLATDLTRP
jgi:hypothetical protein